jgi:hypothetical protein
VKARVLVVKASDGDPYVTPHAIADEYTSEANPEWLDGQVDDFKQKYGSDYICHGFVDIEIPDNVIASVLNQYANAGVVKTEAVES